MSTKYGPGKSGNPGGRPKIAKILAAMQTDAGKLSKELFEKAIEVLRAARRPGNDANWRYAHEWLSNYVLGKPKQVVEQHNVDGPADDEHDFAAMTDEELDDIIAEGDAAVAELEAASEPTVTSEPDDHSGEQS